MICERTIKLFCKDDISLIENYDKAVADKIHTWHCHHRGEILCCGQFSIEDLKKFNLYYNRPANELIFLTHSDHMSMHMKTRMKENPVNLGKHWYNNGMISRRFYATDIPKGFVPGRIKM